MFGSWNDWKLPAVEAECVEPGYWEAHPAKLPKGRHTYKFLLDGDEWLDDPANPKKSPDGLGGFNSVVEVRYFEEQNPGEA